MFRLIMGTTGADAAIATVSWFILNMKDPMMSLADDIRTRTTKKKQEIWDGGLAVGMVKGERNTAERIWRELEAGNNIDDILRRIIENPEQNSQE